MQRDGHRRLRHRPFFVVVVFSPASGLESIREGSVELKAKGKEKQKRIADAHMYKLQDDNNGGLARAQKATSHAGAITPDGMRREQ